MPRFESALVSGAPVTRLEFDLNTASITSIGLYSGTRRIMEYPFAPSPVFTIEFAKYDLNNNVLYDAGNPIRQEYVRYRVDPSKFPTQVQIDTADPPHWIIYHNVQPQPATLNAQPTNYGPIDVVIRFVAPAGAENVGWIELDVSFTCPSQCAADPANFAWQSRIVFPSVKIEKTALVASDQGGTADSWSLLMPFGDLGPLSQIHQSVFGGPAMEVELAALYRLFGSGNLKAIMFSSTDYLGQAKSFNYSQVDTNFSFFDSSFTSPMHLKTVNGKPNFVKPVDLGDTRVGVTPFAFTLARGDDYGFGGAKMRYRIKAVEINNDDTGAPLDWTDVANVYRKWVKAYRPAYFTKEFVRSTTGPMDNMSPFTAITNYGLDGAVAPTLSDPKPAGLPGWLEIFPIKIDNKTDVAVNLNKTSLQDRLKEIRNRVNNRRDDVKLEAQIWGFGPGSYFQWIAGYPPITDILTNSAASPNRFRRAMDALANPDRILASVTTDLIVPVFNRTRFRGHVIKSGEQWKDAINYPFPSQYTDPARNPNPCRFVTTTTLPITEEKTFTSDRVIIVTQSGCQVATKIFPYRRYDAYGPGTFSGPLYNRFYNQAMRPLCPQPEVLNAYLNTCLNNGAFKYGARLIEFMKVDFHLCYQKDHQHIFTSTAGLLYDNVIGPGGWVTARLQQIYSLIQRLGQGIDPRVDGVHDPSFALTRERAPLEPELRWINEYYHRSPVLQFVYGETISAKMDLNTACAHTHPGYSETRKPGPTPAPIPSLLAADYRSTSALPARQVWLESCRTYSDTYFSRNTGLSPQNYPKSDPHGEASYSYNRVVEDLFNETSSIFALGEGAVLGERVYLHSKWFEPPTDANERVINMAARAVHMQMYYAEFLRGKVVNGKTFPGGFMIGKTLIIDNFALFTWRARFRTFDDINLQELRDSAPVLQGERNLPMGVDALSRGVDDDAFCFQLSSPRFCHMIWQKEFAPGDLRTLYLFVNVCNSEQLLSFLYTKGLLPGKTWKKAVRLFDGRDSLGVPLSEGTVTKGQKESFKMAARSTAAVLISSQA